MDHVKVDNAEEDHVKVDNVEVDHADEDHMKVDNVEVDHVEAKMRKLVDMWGHMKQGDNAKLSFAVVCPICPDQVLSPLASLVLQIR